MNDASRTYSPEETGAFVETFAIEPMAEGPLTGLRFAVKDLIDIKGHKTSCGNPTWRDTHPEAAANAVCVDQLLWAGAECLGKTVTDELAFGLDGENHFYGTPLNPKAPDRVPGGSSSGSASAVACGLADFALGTDTGGSVRVPASNCGIFGLRPSHGFVSVAGVNPFAPTFDTVGILAGTCETLIRAASVLLSCEVPDTAETGTIHLVEEAFTLCDREVKMALAQPVEALKHIFRGTVEPTSITEVVGERADKPLQKWYETYCKVQWAEIWSCLGGWVETAQPKFGPRVKVNFELTRILNRGEVQAAVRRREGYYRRLSGFMSSNDLLCLPTAPSVAPLKGSLGMDRTACDYYPRALSMTSIAGIGRLPQVTLPVAEVNGIPIGLSLLGAHGSDAFLLAAARRLLRATPPLLEK